MTRQKYWIRERHNPQLGVYYVACGQLSKTAAKRRTNCLYGSNVMLQFDSKEQYESKLSELREKGERVQ